MSSTHQTSSSTPGAADASLGELVRDMTQQMSTLVRDEMRLAQAELTVKGKQAGIGIGMFGAAGLLALYGLGALVATAILALALVVDAWLAALVVGVVILAVAGVVALVGRGKVKKATPAKPTEAIDGLKEDVAVMKGARS